MIDYFRTHGRPAWEKGRKWINERKSDILLHVIIIPFLLWFWDWLTHSLVDPTFRYVGLLIVFLALIAGATIFLIKRSEKTQTAPQAQSLQGTAPAFAMSANEKQQFQQRIIVFRGEASPHFSGAGDPFILFTFWLFNGYPSAVYIKDLKGRSKFGNNSLSGNAELLGQTQDVSYGDKYKFVIRQWVSDVSMRTILQMINGGARCDFRFDDLFVTVASREPGLETIERRLDLPTMSNVQSKWGVAWE